MALLGCSTGIDGSVGNGPVGVFDIEIEGLMGDVFVGVFVIEIEGDVGMSLLG